MLRYIHILQLNFLFFDWLFCKYAECIENVHFTPRTAPRLRKVLLVRDRARERHIDWSTFFHWVKLLIFFMFSDILKPFYFIILHKHKQMILFFCRVWIRLINLHLLLLVKQDKSNALAWIWCLSNALGPAGLGHWTHQNSVRVHWICLISLEKVNAHLLTSN